MYHLIATRTVQPTLKSAREYCSAPRCPQILKSSTDAQEVYDHALSIVGELMTNQLGHVLNGLPIKETRDWTYWIVRS